MKKLLGFALIAATPFLYADAQAYELNSFELDCSRLNGEPKWQFKYDGKKLDVLYMQFGKWSKYDDGGINVDFVKAKEHPLSDKKITISINTSSPYGHKLSDGKDYGALEFYLEKKGLSFIDGSYSRATLKSKRDGTKSKLFLAKTDWLNDSSNIRCNVKRIDIK
ncbi:MAG: hypothetical protein IE928_10460 [Gammaproteobacteria bacterium]|nr:hypothetical protein [Gammaproteobacteria bacterium]